MMTIPDRRPLLPPRRLWIPALGALALGACAALGPAPPPGVAVSADLPPIPICRDEMGAYVELTRLAKSHGEDWQVFEPAVDALKQQIIDCIGDNSEAFRKL